ncbi:hypothetical protein BHE74_00045578, partial [Ensete ventricosum]
MQFRSILPGTSGTYRSTRLPVRGRPTTGWYRQNQLSTVDFSHRRPIEEEINRRRSILAVGGRLREKEKEEEEKKKKRRRRKKYLLSPRRPRTCVVAARGSPARRRHPCPLAIFLPRKETKRLPTWGERSRRHRLDD